MSDFPTTTASTADIDQGSDQPKLARADLLAAFNLMNQIIGSFNQPNGICGLDAAGMVDASRLPSTIPTGFIGMWSGTIATVPSGWALCDGTNGTPDLRDRMIVAATQDDAGQAKTNITGVLTKSGGAATHTIIEAELPAHSHNAGTLSADNYAVNIPTSIKNCELKVWTDGTPNPDSVILQSGTGHGHTISGSTADAGNGDAVTLLNPYYALAFIMKV